jgi:hypothetical protein
MHHHRVLEDDPYGPLRWLHATPDGLPLYRTSAVTWRDLNGVALRAWGYWLALEFRRRGR